MRTLAALALFAAACAARPERAVGRALEQYRRAIADSDMVAATAMFAPSASLSHAAEPPVIGDSAIGAFLSTFAEFHVLAYRFDVDATRVTGDLAFQHGRYDEAVITPDGRNLEVSGVFEVAWKLRDGHWRITRMHTAPEPK